jgi:uncharacterized membrane protein YcaP (DUF421 family)
MDSKIISDMFHLGLPVGEKIIRPVVVYAFLVVGLRLAGKRELAQLNPFDLVVLLTLSNTVQNAIIGEDNSVTGGLIGAATLLLLNYVVVRLLYGHSHLQELVVGASDVLIEGGKVHVANCRRELISVSELQSAAHRQGLGTLDEVETAILESGGTITFIAKTPTAESVQHDEVMRRLDQIALDLEAIKGTGSTGR